MGSKPWGSVLVVGIAACGPTPQQPVRDSNSESSAGHEDHLDSNGGSGLDAGDPTGAGDSSGAAQDPGATASETGDVDPGALLWERTYDGETHNRDVGVCVAMPDDDTVIVGGFEVLDPFGGDSRSWLAQLDGTGEIVWLEHDARASHEAIAVTASGRVLTAGAAPAQPEGTGWLMTIASHRADGVDEWSIGEPGQSAYDIAIIGEDAIAVGTTQGVPPSAWITRRDALGAELYSIPTEPGTGAFAVAADENTLVVAVADIPEGDVEGTRVWTFDATTAAALGEPIDLGGWSPIALDRDEQGAMLLAFDGDGIQLARAAASELVWSERFAEGSMPLQFEWDLTIDGAGDIIVAGSVRGEEPGGLLRKYTPDGELAWERLHAPGPELAINGVAVAPSGAIVVVGSIRTPDHDWDIWVSRWSP